jgi:hypothetical protein
MRTQFSTTRVWMAGVLAVCMAAGAVHEAGREAGEVIQPKTIHAGEPFTFAVRGSATGEVIEVKTVSGEVVHQGKPDKLGRVFLAAGLPAGAYLVTSALHHTSQNMVVAPATPLTAQAEPLRLDRIQEAINVSEPLRLNGYGFSPKAADMTVNGAPVLAATSNEIVTGPNTQKPGMQELTVVNQSTGETVKSDPVLAYDLQGHLEQRKLITGQQTALRLNFEPKNVPVMVRAAVTKGPVNFGQGRTETLVAVNNGAALVPVHANIGSSGPFELEWFFEKVMEAIAKIATDTPRALLQKKADACAAASALSENSQNRKDLSKEAELDGKAAKDGKNWNKDGTPKDLKKFGDFLNAEIARLEKIAKKEGGGAAAGKIAEAIGAAYDAGTAAGLDLKSGKK